MTDPNSREIPVSLTMDKWLKIGESLGELPLKVAMPLINEINGKINAFLNPAPVEAPSEIPEEAPQGVVTPGQE